MDTEGSILLYTDRRQLTLAWLCRVHGGDQRKRRLCIIKKAMGVRKLRDVDWNIKNAGYYGEYGGAVSMMFLL